MIRKDTISILIFLIVLTTLVYLVITASRDNGESGVVTRMTTLQIEATGSPEFISTENKHLTRARQLMAEEKYTDAHALLFDNYRHSSFNPENYELLYKISIQLCEGDSFYCEQADKWKKLRDRMRKEEWVWDGR